MRCNQPHLVVNELGVGGIATGHVPVQGRSGVPTYVQVTAVAAPGEEGGDAPVFACSVYDVRQNGFRVVVRNVDAVARAVRVYWECEY